MLILFVKMFVFYVAKVASSFGLAATRPVYERAIEVLPDRQAAEMCLRFAQLEQKLGEIDRSRALFAHASQFCDPRTEKDFWAKWNAFEIEHGSEDTFREMLRIRRSVQAQFNTDTSYIAAYASAQHTSQNANQAKEPMDAMSQVEQANNTYNQTDASRTMPAFVAAQKSEQQDNSERLDQAEKGDDDEDLM